MDKVGPVAAALTVFVTPTTIAMANGPPLGPLAKW